MELPHNHLERPVAEQLCDGHHQSTGKSMAVAMPAVAFNLRLFERRGITQPAIKCRGPEYLRIIYGPEYLLPANLERLRSRNVVAKRSLASREFALGALPFRQGRATGRVRTAFLPRSLFDKILRSQFGLG